MAIPGNSTFRDSDLHSIARVAWLYYFEALNQQEIGEQLHLSRITIGRMLQRAREEGIVQFTINTPERVFFELERQLIQNYGLKDAVITIEADPGVSLYQTLAEAASRWLLSNMWKGVRIGLGMGRTISYIPGAFRPVHSLDCTFVEVTGGSALTASGFNQYNITSKMAELAGGRAGYIFAPIIVSSEEAYQSLLNEASIREALERARQCDILIEGIGPVDKSALLYIHGYLNDQELEELKSRGSVGDMLGRYFDHTGKLVENSLDNRIIGLNLDDIARISWSVVVAGGSEKIPALQAAFSGHLINVLITDIRTARLLLSKPNAIP